jgi:beta-phosphoglucomutase
MPTMIDCCIFDLDGVIVDTAKYHYLAWKRLATGLGFDFTEHDNERLKGVSRVESLKIILSIGKTELAPAAFELALKNKNDWYLDYINKIGAEEILPGVSEFLAGVRARGIKTTLGSASKNARLILERIGLVDQFDAIVDGNSVTNAKPDPEVFLTAARAVNVAPERCVVFEDAAAGVEAALNAHMKCVGIGSADVLGKAHILMPGFAGVDIDTVLKRLP